MVKHNNILPNGHYKKYWQKLVKTWLNQPARAQRRRLHRQKKAAATFPRPTAGLLRPIVHPPTKRYNHKVRLGRGFTLDELKEAGIPRSYAQTIGIAVDHRRKNRCTESLQTNVDRLKTYKSKLILFPRKNTKPRKGDATKADMESATQCTDKEILPIARDTNALVGSMAVTSEMKEFRPFAAMRLDRANKKLKGKREKAKAEAEEASKKKMKANFTRKFVLLASFLRPEIGCHSFGFSFRVAGAGFERRACVSRKFDSGLAKVRQFFLEFRKEFCVCEFEILNFNIHCSC
eukprot:gene446-891_t